jgi:hypothetical protein
LPPDDNIIDCNTKNKDVKWVSKVSNIAETWCSSCWGCWCTREQERE